MQYDYLIVGLGISGTMLSRKLLQAGKSVLIIDNGYPNTASRCAGGIINPITGMRMVRSWMADELFPTAVQEYAAIEQELGGSYITPVTIIEFLQNKEQQQLYVAKLITETEYLQNVVDDTLWQQYFNYSLGVGCITGSYHLKVALLLADWRQKMLSNNNLLIDSFDLNALTLSNDGVRYKNINAEKIIFCDGVMAAQNPWFQLLPWSKDKGEALIVEIQDLPPVELYKQGGLTIAPWQNGLFWVGAAHDWKYTSPHPSDAFKQQTIAHLNHWLKLPYKVVDHIAALRPANMDRKPFVGLHPLYKNVGILNGMGGKGFSMAPYFASQLANNLINATPILPHANVSRYKRILSLS